MGKLTTFKRELRALYKPKPRDSEVEKQQNTHAAIELDSRNSTQSRPHSACEEPLPCAYVSGQVYANSPSDHEDVYHPETGSTPQPKNAPRQETEVKVSDPNDTSRQTLDVEEAEQEGTELQDPEPDEIDASAADDSDEPLTFEEAEAVRETTYIAFSSEAPEDYTSGPPRFVFASDGLQDCGALLMTFEFSQRVQTAIEKQRNFEVMKSQGLSQRWALTRLETKVQGAIASCNTQLVRLEDLEGEEHQEQRQALQQRATVLEAMLLDVGGRKQEVIVGVETEAEILREVFSSVVAYLEDAFVYAKLVEPEIDTPEEMDIKLDLEEEYLIFCEKLRAAGDPMAEVGEIVPLDDNKDHLKAEPLSEEDQKKQNIINDLWAAKQTLLQARNAFENRAAQQAQEYQANVAAANENRSTTDESPEAFDIRWVQRTQALTRALIDAEAAYSAAKRHALDEGVPVESDGDDQCSGFGDPDAEDDAGGYRMSAEQEMITSVSSPTMRKWLSAVREGGEVGSVGEEVQDGDEWEADEVGISDSVSLVAEGRERARIDRWRNACEKRE